MRAVRYPGSSVETPLSLGPVASKTTGPLFFELAPLARWEARLATGTACVQLRREGTLDSMVHGWSRAYEIASLHAGPCRAERARPGLRAASPRSAVSKRWSRCKGSIADRSLRAEHANTAGRRSSVTEVAAVGPSRPQREPQLRIRSNPARRGSIAVSQVRTGLQKLAFASAAPRIASAVRGSSRTCAPVELQRERRRPRTPTRRRSSLSPLPLSSRMIRGLEHANGIPGWDHGSACAAANSAAFAIARHTCAQVVNFHTTRDR